MLGLWVEYGSLLALKIDGCQAGQGQRQETQLLPDHRDGCSIDLLRVRLQLFTTSTT